MADTLEQLAAGVFNYTSISSNGVLALMSVPSNTRYAVKDVLANHEFPQCRLVVDTNYTVVDDLRGRLEGLEIIGPGSLVTVEINSKANDASIQPAFFTSNSAVYTTTGYLYFSDNLRSDNAGIAPTFTTSSLASTGFGTATAYYAHVNTGGVVTYAYTDGNSSTVLYRNTTTVVNQAYTIFCYDGGNRYYYLGTSNIMAYNISTNNTSTLAAVSSINRSTYPRGAFCNGLAFFMENYSSTRLIIYNTANNTVYTPSITTYGGSETAMLVTYDSVLYRYTVRIHHPWSSVSNPITYVIQSNSTNTSFSVISGPLNTSLPASTGAISFPYNANQILGRYYFVRDSSGYPRLIDKNMLYAGARLATVSNPYEMTMNPAGHLSSLPSSNSPVAQLVLRITGVKSA